MSEQTVTHFRDYKVWYTFNRPIKILAELENGWSVEAHRTLSSLRPDGIVYSASIRTCMFGPFDTFEEAMACATAPRAAIHTERQMMSCEESDGLRESMVEHVETLRAVDDIPPSCGDVDVWLLPDGSFLHDYRPYYEGTCAHWVAKEPSYG